MESVEDQVVPARTEGMALDDPYTRLRCDMNRRLHRRYTGYPVAFALIAAALFVLGAGHPAPAVTAAAVLATLVAAFWVLHLVMSALRRRAVHEGLSRLPWRPVTCTSLADRSPRSLPVVTVLADGRTWRMRLNRVAGLTELLRVRAGRAWLCGPDERGVGYLRVPGSENFVRALVIGGPPDEYAVPLSEPGELRHPDLPEQSRAWRQVGQIAVIVAVVGAVGVVSYLDALRRGDVGQMLLGELVAALGVLLTLQAGHRLRPLPPWRRRDSAGLVVAHPFQLESFAPAARMCLSARGRLQLPDGRWVRITLPRADISVIANLRAGATPGFRGTPAPGEWLAVSVAGCPHLAMARIDRHPEPAV